MKLLFGKNPIPQKDSVHKFPQGTLGFLVGGIVEQEKEIEVMIVGRGKQNLTNGYPKVVFLKPVNENHILVNTQGFIRTGYLCSETAELDNHDEYQQGIFVTPGTTPVYVATDQEPIPHRVWVDKRVRQSRLIAVGLDSLDHLPGIIDK